MIRRKGSRRPNPVPSGDQTSHFACPCRNRDRCGRGPSPIGALATCMYCQCSSGIERDVEGLGVSISRYLLAYLARIFTASVRVLSILCPCRTFGARRRIIDFCED